MTFPALAFYKVYNERKYFKHCKSRRIERRVKKKREFISILRTITCDSVTRIMLSKEEDRYFCQPMVKLTFPRPTPRQPMVKLTFPRPTPRQPMVKLTFPRPTPRQPMVRLTFPRPTPRQPMVKLTFPRPTSR